MNILEFMGNHPFLTVFILLIFVFLIEVTMKQINIFKHGWPPSLCECEQENEQDNTNRSDGQ